MKSQLEVQFIEMLNKNKNAFYKLAYSYVKNEANALDMIGEATYSALNALPTLRNSKYMKTWFYRILINTCNQFLRKNKNIIYEMDLINNIPSTECDRESIIDLHSAISKLKSPYRETIILKYFQQLTIAEISQVLNKNQNTIKSYLRRGIAQLKKFLGGN
jgi:RNA polymerase sigma-70 factor (ECF subfamily)